ncbi:hypothetical protein ABKN59_005783 [Abortiporus biennis]
MEQRFRHSVVDTMAITPTGPTPRPMRYSDLPTTVDTTMAASNSDPLHQYVTETSDRNYARFLRLNDIMWRYIEWSVRTYTQSIWTIDGGKGFVTIDGGDRTFSKSQKLVRKIGDILTRGLHSFRSRELRNRLAEFKDKTNDIIMSNLGQERAKEMIGLSGIAVHPDLQGIGYGTQLGQVDVFDGRESFVISSNEAANTAFYKYLGYETVATYTVGESNPAWKKPPVHLALLVRKSMKQ